MEPRQRNEQRSDSSARRDLKRRVKRQRILEAARELFSEHGFEGATARDISRRAGVATGTLFLYVEDKRELLLEVIAEDAEPLFQRGARAAEAARSLPDALMALFGPFFDYYAQRPALARSILQELFLRPHGADRVGAFARQHAAHVARLVAAAKGRGELDGRIPVGVAARACFAHYAFWIQAWLGTSQLNRVQFEARLGEAWALQLRGLQGPAGAGPSSGSEH